MLTFDKMMERILSHEGGYVNDPRDPGGETNWGIAKRSYPKVNIKSLTRKQALEIYREDFYAPINQWKFHPALEYQLLDAAINHGRGNAIRWLQRAVGVADDGVVGPVTRSKVNSHLPDEVVIAFNAERLQFYTNLTTWPTFGKGWARRIAQNLRYAMEDL